MGISTFDSPMDQQDVVVPICLRIWKPVSDITAILSGQLQWIISARSSSSVLFMILRTGMYFIQTAIAFLFRLPHRSCFFYITLSEFWPVYYGIQGYNHLLPAHQPFCTTAANSPKGRTRTYAISVLQIQPRRWQGKINPGSPHPYRPVQSPRWLLSPYSSSTLQAKFCSGTCLYLLLLL